jgi:hypothetical protein
LDDQKVGFEIQIIAVIVIFQQFKCKYFFISITSGLVAVGKGAAEGVDKLAETVMGQEAKVETAQAFDTLARYLKQNIEQVGGDCTE